MWNCPRKVITSWSNSTGLSIPSSKTAGSMILLTGDFMKKRDFTSLYTQGALHIAISIEARNARIYQQAVCRIVRIIFRP